MEKTVKKFFKKFVVTSGGGCWLWIGNKDKDGYGRFCINHNEEIRSHRYSYQLFRGKVPKNKFVCHSCDNPSCVNPHHLWLGTVLDNHRDMDNKGRRVSVAGEKHGNSKLTQNDVQFINICC
jgi:hypothetical protein